MLKKKKYKIKNKKKFFFLYNKKNFIMLNIKKKVMTNIYIYYQIKGVKICIIKIFNILKIKI